MIDIPAGDHWWVARVGPPTPDDPRPLTILAPFADQPAAAAETARLDALEPAGGARHTVLVAVRLTVTEARELP